MAKLFKLERIVIHPRTVEVQIYPVWEKKGMRWVQRMNANNPELCEFVKKCRVGTIFKIGEGGKGNTARYRLIRTK